MKIVDRTTFKAMPVGTVFQEYGESYISQLRVLTHVYDEFDDYIELEITGMEIIQNNSSEQLMHRQYEMEESGAEYPLEFDQTSRNGCFGANQRYAVWSDDDVSGLIRTLQESLATRHAANPGL